jgi:hypothetical protein
MVPMFPLLQANLENTKTNKVKWQELLESGQKEAAA